jgi:hypothetical protein
MTIFDLLFLVAVLASVVTFVFAAVLAVRGGRARALKFLRCYSACVVSYFLISLAVAFFKPQRVIRTGDPWCLDDWCLSVDEVRRIPGQRDISYRLGLRIFSRARRVAQRANGAWIYLIDERGHRYSPDPDPSLEPLDVVLQPQESITTSRLFHLPNDVHQIGLITGHGGAYCGPMAFLVIGESGCLFKKPTMIRIP